jgi:type III restriction enzyme
MDSVFIQKIQEKVATWRAADYPGVYDETRTILRYIKGVHFLHKPQVEALETYIYLKEVEGNKHSLELFRASFSNELEFLRALGISDSEALDLAYDVKKGEKIQTLLEGKFGASDYANQVYALTMGAGKTILMATMMLYDFSLSFYHPDDERFAKNILVFAPDTTIIDSLKEIKTFDYTKVLPRGFRNILLNIKYHYLESPDTPLSPIGNYNIIVSNSQKIILKRRNGDTGMQSLFAEHGARERQMAENARLFAIRQLDRLAIFVDEAHHSYGETMDKELKRTRETIEYIHGNKPLVSVINLTGTPYVKRQMIADVVYHFGLKSGIERGILKQVRILDYGEVRSEKFVAEVLDTFFTEYGGHQLEGRLPKIALYAASIANLREELRPMVEKILAQKGISSDVVLEYHTEAEDNKEEFQKLDTIESTKQVILLVGKGTEGWNCRSLVACALYRKPKSTIFVLQSATRCLRAIGDNSTIARIFLSKENYNILDRELKHNFAISAAELSAQDQEVIDHELKVEKRKTITVQKVLKEIVAVKHSAPDTLRIDFKRFRPDDYHSYVREGGIFINRGRASYQEAHLARWLNDENNRTFYEIAELINRRTHIPCSAIERIVTTSGKSRDAFVQDANKNPAIIPFVIQEILDKAYQYEWREEIIEEDLELTKLYPFKISVQPRNNKLVVYREQEEETGRLSRIGFHINPYNFDSGDERDLFRYFREVLDVDEAIVDLYFTGGVASEKHNDFYFQYWSPDLQRSAKYFPDFLVETTKGRYLVVEVKSSAEKGDYEANKRSYTGNVEQLTNEVYAKQVGFEEFQKANKNFEYRIIFSAGLQAERLRLLNDIKNHL